MSKGEVMRDCAENRQVRAAYITKVEQALAGARYPRGNFGDFKDIIEDVLEACIQRNRARRILKDE